MALPRGTRLGPYEIGALIGAGGMGEVYRAHDARLDRPVAVKILHGDSGSPERRGRFEREARAIAALTHPHICTVYDVGHHEGTDFLVMELLEGETLNARLAKGPLAIAEVLAYAIQIADALDNAHRHGIVHRDLKPANVLLTRSGAKLLDFGLAKLRSATPSMLDAPTEAAPLTAHGEILGTLAYMSPEQLEGRQVDARTDIFAFGAIVFEMVTGKRAFDGSSQASLIGAVLHTAPPPITRVTPGAPPALERLVAVCLSKDPEERWSTAHDVLLHLKGIPEASEIVAAPVVPRRLRRERLAYGAALVASLAAIGLAALLWSGRAAPKAADAPLDVLAVLAPDGTTLDHGEAPQISPDGRRLAFVATDAAGRTAIYIRNRDSLVARPLPDTDGASLIFWSPDGGRLAFFALGQLKTIAIAGGSPHAIARAPLPRGGSWGKDDLILFSAEPNAAPRLVPAGGGDATPVPFTAKSIGFFAFPTFLPDGRHYLFMAVSARFLEPAGFPIRVGSIDSPEAVELTRSMANPLVASGHLLFRRDATLVAQPFDMRTLRLSGSPVPVVEEATFNPITNQGLFSVSNDGVLAYQRATPGSQMIWFDRQGRRLEAAAPPGDSNTLCLTADQSRIVYEQADLVSGSLDIWALEKGGVPSRLTFNRAIDFYPVCAPVGSDIVFATLRDGPPNLYRLNITAPGSEKPILQSFLPKIANDWSRDGHLLVYSVMNANTNWDIEVMPIGGGPSTPFAASPAEERNARLSPDGRWMAYNSNESGSFEVYVQPFPATGAKWQVSKGGGQEPQWRHDGRELFYIAPDRKLIGVLVQTGGVFVPGAARALVETRITSWERSSQGSQYAVTADGERFLVNNATDATLPITLVLNWTAVLKK
jgi:Tol biopolymer transport system component